jgi:Tfp pilus assembly protein PilF
MTTAEISLLEAERELAAGRPDNARSALERAHQEDGDSAAFFHLTALVEKSVGNAAAAEAAFEAALNLDPTNPQLLMNFGNFRQALGQVDQSLELYDRALAQAPDAIDIRFNRLLALTALRRVDEALAEAESLLRTLPAEPRLHSTHGVILRALGRLREAGQAFERALELDPQALMALHGRAQIAADRDEDAASGWYRKALVSYPNSGDLIIGLAGALEGEGRADEAATTLEGALRANPSWIEGQAALARMRWEASKDDDFIRDLEAALSAEPANGPMWSVLATTLAGADLPAAAAQAASEGVRATGGDTRLRLLQAFLVSEAGDVERADELFAELPAGLPGRHFSEARHALRAHRFDQASKLLDEARQESPWDIAAWAMTSLAWRLTGDPRAEWLNQQPGLIRILDLDLSPAELDQIAERLRALHRTRVRPLHQSLRGGTQSRGRLFEREEPEIALFARKIREAVERYWLQLPDTDSAHPLLRHRGRKPIIEGSWSA